jgi:uncharacterized membrane protein
MIDLSGKKPLIKIKQDTYDWIIESIGVIFLIVLIVIPLVYYKQLPERIPVHFNGSGQADGFGGKSSIWLFPLAGLIIWLIMTVVAAYNIFNYPVKITLQNAHIQYRLATRLIKILKVLILPMFSFISYRTIQTALGKVTGLGKIFLPVFLLIIAGVIVIYITQALNNR